MDKPRIFDLSVKKEKDTFENLSSTALVVDEIKEQIKELELVKNPGLLATPEKLNLNKNHETVWIYYPWRNTLVHCLNEKDFKLLRTSRNQNLILDVEQEKFDGALVGMAGLNVGNPGAICVTLESGISMKLADNDVLSVSNLNRFRAGLPDLGLNKAVLTARQAYEINPFADLEVFDKGISDNNIEKFLLEPRIDVLVEETDSLQLKIKIRELARKNKIPVVMVTGSGEDLIIDLERFDMEPELDLLNGHLKNQVIEGIKSGPKSFDEKIQLMMDFMGEEFLNERLVKSFRQVGSSLAGIPQLAESSFLRGAAISYFVRQIITGGKAKSGRFNFKLTDVQRS